MYIESTRGHNTVEIDRNNYSRFRQDSFGSAITLVAKADNHMIIEGSVHHKRLIHDKIPNNKIKSSDAIPVDVTHRRIIIESPGQFLAIIDNLSSPQEHEYIPWFHLHPKYSVRNDTNTRLAVIDEDRNRICQVQCYDNYSNNIDYVKVRGQKEPNLQGWYSHNGRELIDNIAIGFPSHSNTICQVTVFDFMMKKSSKPYLRMGTNGKYIRFSFSQEDKKSDIKIILNDDGKREIEAIIDGKPTPVSVEFEEV